MVDLERKSPVIRGIASLIKSRKPKARLGKRNPDPVVKLTDFRRLYVGNFQ